MKINIPHNLPTDPKAAYRKGFKEGLRGVARMAAKAGGKARAESLTAKRRTEIAKKAAAASAKVRQAKAATKRGNI